MGPTVGLEPKGNVVEDNYAYSFRLENDKIVKSKDNRKVTEKIYEKARMKLLDMIEKAYGKTHPVAGFERVGPEKSD